MSLDENKIVILQVLKVLNGFYYLVWKIVWISRLAFQWWRDAFSFSDIKMYKKTTNKKNNEFKKFDFNRKINQIMRRKNKMK